MFLFLFDKNLENLFFKCFLPLIIYITNLNLAKLN